MGAGFPGDSGLESIGSVAANFSRTEEEEERAEFLRYSHGSAMVSFIFSHSMCPAVLVLIIMNDDFRPI